MVHFCALTCFRLDFGGFFIFFSCPCVLSHPWLEREKMNTKTKKIVMLGLFSAIAFVFTVIGNVIPIRFAGFLSFDPKDAIIVIAGFALGPLATIIISVLVALIELITISGTGPIGFLMNILASVSFALLPAIVYNKKRTFKNAMLALLASSIMTVAIMLLWNWLVTPLYLHVPREAVVGQLLPVFLPFNALKCAINVVLIAVLYKPCVRILRRVKLLEPSKKDEK